MISAQCLVLLLLPGIQLDLSQCQFCQGFHQAAEVLVHRQNYLGQDLCHHTVSDCFGVQRLTVIYYNM